VAATQSAHLRRCLVVRAGRVGAYAIPTASGRSSSASFRQYPRRSVAVQWSKSGCGLARAFRSAPCGGQASSPASSCPEAAVTMNLYQGRPHARGVEGSSMMSSVFARCGGAVGPQLQQRRSWRRSVLPSRILWLPRQPITRNRRWSRARPTRRRDRRGPRRCRGTRRGGGVGSSVRRRSVGIGRAGRR